MKTLVINTVAESVAIISMMEGQHEVAKDDNDASAITWESVMEWYRAAITYAKRAPYTLHLSTLDASAIEAIEATLENIGEQGDDWNVGGEGDDDTEDSVPFTAAIVDTDAPIYAQTVQPASGGDPDPDLRSDTDGDCIDQNGAPVRLYGAVAVRLRQPRADVGRHHRVQHREGPTGGHGRAAGQARLLDRPRQADGAGSARRRPRSAGRDGP